MSAVKMVKWNCRGVTRDVFLTKRWAIKIPKLTHGWRLFLYGLLANLQEVTFGRNGWRELCPVVWHFPGGWFLVMPRAEPLSDTQWKAFDPKKFCDSAEHGNIPAEWKQDSFGILNGRIVAIDYGNHGWRDD